MTPSGPKDSSKNGDNPGSKPRGAGRLADDRDGTAIITALEQLGLLFLSDPKRQNAIQILTGEFPRGSWWSHPDANAIYAILQTVEQHPDVLMAKLLSGKVTLIHRGLWPALLAVVNAREPWQMEGLSPGASTALVTLEAQPSSPQSSPAEAEAEAEPIGRTVTKELEARLLARSESVHTAVGKHVTKLEAWPTWAARAGCAWPPTLAVAEGKRALEAAAGRLWPPAAELPWGHDG